MLNNVEHQHQDMYLGLPAQESLLLPPLPPCLGITDQNDGLIKTSITNQFLLSQRTVWKSGKSISYRIS